MKIFREFQPDIADPSGATVQPIFRVLSSDATYSHAHFASRHTDFAAPAWCSTPEFCRFTGVDAGFPPPTAA